MFKALADPAQLHTLILLAEQERNVGELAEIEGVQLGTVSARLVARRREGKAAIYSIADVHVLHLVENAIAHICEDH